MEPQMETCNHIELSQTLQGKLGLGPMSPTTLHPPLSLSTLNGYPAEVRVTPLGPIPSQRCQPIRGSVPGSFHQAIALVYCSATSPRFQRKPELSTIPDVWKRSSLLIDGQGLNLVSQNQLSKDAHCQARWSPAL